MGGVFSFYSELCDSLQCFENKQLGLHFSNKLFRLCGTQKHKGGIALYSLLKTKHKTPDGLVLYVYTQGSTFLAHRSAQEDKTPCQIVETFFFSSGLSNTSLLIQWEREMGQGLFAGPVALEALPSAALALGLRAVLQLKLIFQLFVLFDRETTTDTPCRGRSGIRQFLQSNC